MSFNCKSLSFNLKLAISLIPVALLIWFFTFYVVDDQHTILHSTLIGLYFTVVGSIAGCLIAESNQRTDDKKHKELLREFNDIRRAIQELRSQSKNSNSDG